MGLVDTTTYRVETEMRTKDESSAAFAAIARSAEVATKAVEKMKSGLGLLGVGLGFHEAKKHLFDFNADLEDYRVKMAGMLTLFTKANMSQSWDRAGESVETFNKMATKSALTTKELVNMASLIERPLLNAGVSMSEIERLTFGAANAAKAFGTQTGLAARDVEYMLTRGVHIRDKFAINLLAQRSVGLSATQFNALDISHKVSTLEKALKSPEILEMARKQGEETFHGVMSTFEDNMQLLGGRIGLPLFKAITQEVRGWTLWMEKNEIAIHRFADTLSKTIVTGFKYIKDVASFLYDHSDALISLGKIWAVASIGGSLGGGLGMGGGNLGALTATLNPLGASIANSVRAGFLSMAIKFPSLIGPMNMVGRFGGMLGNLGSAAGALGPAGILGIGYAAHELGEYIGVHKALTAAIDPARYKLIALKESMDIFDDAVQRTAKSMGGEKGALGTNNAINAIASVDMMKTQVNVLKDIQAGRYQFSKNPMLWESSQRKLLKSAGFDEDESKNLVNHPYYRAGLIGTLQSKIAEVGSRTYLAAHETDKGVAAAMGLMSPSERASIDANKATQMVMEKFMQLFSSSGYGMTGLNAALMSPEEIKKFLLKDSLDPFKGGTVNQNITNHINVEVSAKDPDRWLLELDEKVQRKIRAPSQARGSVITRGGL